jgi:hypothetical protein
MEFGLKRETEIPPITHNFAKSPNHFPNTRSQSNCKWHFPHLLVDAGWPPGKIRLP